MRTGTGIVLGVALLALAACGSGGGGGGMLAGGPGSKWVKDDACKTVDKAVVAAATGQTVTSAENTTMDGPAIVATCTYQLSDGVATVMTRISGDDLSDAEIATMRDAGGLMDKGEVLPGYGMTAFWSDKTHQLQLFADRKHYAGIVYMDAMTLPGAPKPKSADPKAVATAIAKHMLS